ncbi:MAG: hypothetical protein ACKVS8_03270 [Phycisphaerales bacterium]
MATSQKAFDQVKNILGRLDRNIDSLREQRTGGSPNTTGSGAASNGATGHGPGNGQHGPVTNGVASPALVSGPRFAADQLIGLPKVTPPSGPNGTQPLTPFSPQPNQAPRSPWGRAQPLRRDAGAA